MLGKEESDEEAAEDALVSPAAQGVNLRGVKVDGGRQWGEGKEGRVGAV